GPFADLILIHANIRTMDESHPTAQALAVVGNRIAAVGTTRQIRALAGRQTRMINAEGRLVLPGFNDAHVHFLSGGFQLLGVDLRSANSREEIRSFQGPHSRRSWQRRGPRASTLHGWESRAFRICPLDRLWEVIR